MGPEWLTGRKSSDWFKIVNISLFAFSNGYCSTQCAIKSPSRASPETKEAVGQFVGIFLITGIVIGSVIAIGVGMILPINLK